MSVIVDAREVLACLNHLGYTNINARQLKEFMIDLKKLIKYEEWCIDNQKKQRQYEQKQEPKLNRQLQSEDIFEILHNSETVASLARKKNKKRKEDHIIRVQINKPCCQPTYENIVPAIVIPEDSDTEPFVSSSCSHECLQHAAATTTTLTASAPTPENAIMPSSSKCPSLALTKTTETNQKTRPQSSRSSFIRPKVINKPLKSDPVALYHQYKKEWDKIKFPGDHQHHDTRWAVREKLLGERN